MRKSALVLKFHLCSSSRSLHSTSMELARQHKRVDTSTLEDSTLSLISASLSTSACTEVMPLSNITSTTSMWKYTSGILLYYHVTKLYSVHNVVWLCICMHNVAWLRIGYYCMNNVILLPIGYVLCTY